MSGNRDIDISGNKLINLGDPTEPQDAATKDYIDILINNIHDLTPTSNANEYIRYINNRNTLLHSIAGIVGIRTDIDYDGKTTPGHENIPYIMLHSNTSSHQMMLTKGQQLKGMYIAFEFHFPLNVNSFIFNTCRDVYEDWEIQYVLEYSEHGLVWVTLPGVKTVKTLKKEWLGNNSLLVLKNEVFTRAKYWRIVFQHAVTNNNAIYLNYLRIHVCV